MALEDNTSSQKFHPLDTKPNFVFSLSNHCSAVHYLLFWNWEWSEAEERCEGKILYDVKRKSLDQHLHIGWVCEGDRQLKHIMLDSMSALLLVMLQILYIYILFCPVSLTVHIPSKTNWGPRDQYPVLWCDCHCYCEEVPYRFCSDSVLLLTP